MSFLCYCCSTETLDKNDVNDSKEEFIVKEEDIKLSARDCDDTFTLMKGFNPRRAYCIAFCGLDDLCRVPEIGLSGGDKGGDKIFQDLCDRLDRGTKNDYKGLNADLTLFLAAIGKSKFLEEMMEMIDAYEIYKDKYNYNLLDDQINADVFLRNARSSLNNKERRLLYYQKAIYHTHSLKEKEIIKLEYNLFCEKLISLQ